ncbi:MAG: hypothetical protein RIB65_21035 [Ilumatobacter fluminis]|uniref:prenyltransferase n=1 Tax=Ilumatobacter fluminis TaxID=467091 RepID=UPI0032F0629E
MSRIPDLPGIISSDEIVASAEHLAGLQTDSGMIPWWPGGHCDAWNHVESAMALDVAGLHREAERAYEWLADIQRPDGSWHNYYVPDGDRDMAVEDDKVDTNVVAYIATGVWHHWKCTSDRSFVDNLWPTVERALDHVLSLRKDDGLVLWAVEADGTRRWDYALLTGSSSIQHALRCGAAVGLATGSPRPDWVDAADRMCSLIANEPLAFQPKTRWAMDWYYPVLTGAIEGEAAKIRLADGWPTFSMEGLGIRCVSDEPWITASETAEASLAYASIGEFATATDLLRWTRSHRCPDGSYLTGLVYPDKVVFPEGETSSYTAAAVVLAADAIAGASPGSDLFVRSSLRPS